MYCSKHPLHAERVKGVVCEWSEAHRLERYDPAWGREKAR
jgi:hypothetical protein